MYPLTAKSVAMLATLLSLGNHADASGPGQTRTPQPVILKVTTDFQEHRMTISGRYFGNEEPSVRLAHRILPVTSHTADQVVVNLPSGIRPATYGLTVTAEGSHRVTSDVFSTALFAVN